MQMISNNYFDTTHEQRMKKAIIIMIFYIAWLFLFFYISLTL